MYAIRSYYEDAPASGIPHPGEVWVDERMAALMSLQVGDSLNLGRSRLRVAQFLTYEPDRGLNFFSVAPRLMMNLADVEETGLIAPGSRVSYRLLLAGDYRIIKQFRSSIDKT